MKIEFDDFIIREPQLEDAERYLAYVKKNFEHIASSAPITVKTVIDLASAKAFIEKRNALAERKESYTFTLFDKDNKHMIAQLVIMHIDWTVPKGEIGYHIDEDFQCKGIMTKLVAIISDYAFTQFGFQKLFMRIQEKNKSSKRVAEKNNYIHEGLLIKDYRTYENELVDVIYFGKCKQ